MRWSLSQCTNCILLTGEDRADSIDMFPIYQIPMLEQIPRYTWNYTADSLYSIYFCFNCSNQWQCYMFFYNPSPFSSHPSIVQMTSRGTLDFPQNMCSYRTSFLTCYAEPKVFKLQMADALSSYYQRVCCSHNLK